MHLIGSIFQPKQPFVGSPSNNYQLYTPYPFAMKNGLNGNDSGTPKTTTTTTIGNGKGGADKANGNAGGERGGSPVSVECPRGIGETTYTEWFSKVYYRNEIYELYN